MGYFFKKKERDKNVGSSRRNPWKLPLAGSKQLVNFWSPKERERHQISVWWPLLIFWVLSICSRTGTRSFFLSKGTGSVGQGIGGLVPTERYTAAVKPSQCMLLVLTVLSAERQSEKPQHDLISFQITAHWPHWRHDIITELVWRRPWRLVSLKHCFLMPRTTSLVLQSVTKPACSAQVAFCWRRAHRLHGIRELVQRAAGCSSELLLPVEKSPESCSLIAVS